MNRLFYGDNLEILRQKIRPETVDLCYIDPPFNSKRNYNQIYTNVGSEDLAQEQAFVDTWTWDDRAREGYQEIIANQTGLYPVQATELIKGLKNVLGEGSLLAYLISMMRRVTEIHRVLKRNGTFYFHCDPTASHYLKLVLDAVFCSQAGNFLNEIVWCYRGGGVPRKDFARKHDIIFRYSKSDDYTFNVDEVRIPYSESVLESPVSRFDKSYRSNKVYEGYRPNTKGKHPEDWWTIQPLMPSDRTERLGYPTQKPRALLSQIVLASSNPGDVVLDAFCGCGTTVDVAQRTGRQWIGMDITYQSIALVLKRIEDIFGKKTADAVQLDGVPKDMASARALAHKRDDRVRKEFEKWAVLTYTMNRAAINSKKGADGGIDATAYFWRNRAETDKAVFQVKSGSVGRGDIAKLKGDMDREKAAVGTLITLEEPTQPMRVEAKRAGVYADAFTGRNHDRVQIVTIREILEHERRLELPLTADVLRVAEAPAPAYQPDLNLDGAIAKRMAKATIKHKAPRKRRRSRCILVGWKLAGSQRARLKAGPRKDRIR